jgi:SAM-dependent methyltransferase
MDKHDAFQGSPWNVEPTEDWNRPSWWDSFYRDLFAEADPWGRGMVIHREIEMLLRMMTAAGELPRRATSRTFLDAGCGIALIPHVLAYWGFQVTAIDSCGQAIEVAAPREPSEEELARCVPIWDPCHDGSNCRVWVEDPARSLQRLRSYQAPGGSVSYSCMDWFSAELPGAGFGLIYCRNSLRCSTKPYWRPSLRRFHELLSPGGALLLETLNAIGIEEEVTELLEECGFSRLEPGVERQPPARYVIDVWPTG